MRAVHVGIGHDDDARVPQFGDIEHLADIGPERDHQIFYFIICQHLVQPRALHV